uniref:Uncharacterized protein n=1 Tax=Globisporangium ultimum (strain ATCC 200006 / CBS 805.95 / DAOM BR144) TaxID=431595 RepID=K3WB33_GLOUD
MYNKTTDCMANLAMDSTSSRVIDKYLCGHGLNNGTETEEHINVHKAVSIAVGLHKFVVVSLSLTEYITKLQLDVLKNMQQGS